MARIPIADPETLDPAARVVYEGMRSQAARTLAHAAGAFVPWTEMTLAIGRSPDLDPVIRELIILRTVSRLESDYIAVQHVANARTVGATASQIAAACGTGPIKGPAGVVVAFVDDLYRGLAPGDERVAEVLEVLSARGLVEAILTGGNYQMVARLVEAVGLEPEPAITESGDFQRRYIRPA